jgi:hypothetical protein
MELESLLIRQHREWMFKMDVVIVLLSSLVRQNGDIMAALDDLTAQVKANSDVEASAVVLIQGLATQIANNTSDPAALAALSTQLKTSADALAAAITANTPAAPKV